MRWHSFTPSITSRAAGSKSSIGPTPPSTVCRTPVERWTVNPISTSRWMTFSVCCSVAPSCMTTNIRSLPAFLQHFYFLYCSHLINDAFEDALDRLVRERAAIMPGNVLKHLIFPLGLVDRQLQFLFDAADFFDNGGALVQNPEQRQIEFVNLLAATRQVFERIAAHCARNGAVNRRVNASNSAAMFASAICFSICRTIALPTTTPSATLAASRACSGVLIPNPAASGRSVNARILFASGSSASDSEACSPVTPVRETR